MKEFWKSVNIRGKLTHVGFRAHVKIASRIVSYRGFLWEDGTRNVHVWEFEDIHTSCQHSLLIFIRNLFLSVLYIALSSEIVFIVFFGFAALYCTSFWLCFLCLLFDVRLSHLINITYIHTYIASTICRVHHSSILARYAMVMSNTQSIVWQTTICIIAKACKQNMSDKISAHQSY